LPQAAVDHRERPLPVEQVVGRVARRRVDGRVVVHVGPCWYKPDASATLERVRAVTLVHKKVLERCQKKGSEASPRRRRLADIPLLEQASEECLC